MNTNKDSSTNTFLKKTKSVSAFYASFRNAVNAGIAKLPFCGVSNTDSSVELDIYRGNLSYTNELSTFNMYNREYTYVYFFTPGSVTWTAPMSILGSITYWLVGGGGGGGGAYDNGGGGGGAGGSVVTGSFSVTPGQQYTIVVGDGGAGGTGRGTTGSIPGTSTDGQAGGASSFDSIQALGGGGGKSRLTSTMLGGAASSPGVAAQGGGGGGDGGSGGGGGGSFTAGTNGRNAGSNSLVGAGGQGIQYAFDSINSGINVTYGDGGNGGSNPTSGYINGTSGLSNTGDGGKGGSAASSNGALGGNGGSGLVVIQIYA